MPTSISDGKGGGALASVDSINRLEVHALDDDRLQAINGGLVWSLGFDQIDPVGADDFFVYIKNTSSDQTYLFTDLRVSSTVAGSVEIHKVTGTASYTADAAMDVTSRNLGSSVDPNLISKTDTNTTGLTSGGVLFTVLLEANKRTKLTTTAGIVIPPSTAMALRWDTSTGVLTGTVSISKVNTD